MTTTMKTLFTMIGALLITSVVFAQAPEKLSYQSVIRNTTGNLVANSPVGIKISIIQTTPIGPVAYAETHLTATNTNGLVTIEIGVGTPISGTFAAIDWSNGPYYLKTETDPTGGTNYTISGTNEMLSVPYALYAKTSGSSNGTTGRYVGELFGGGVVFYVDKSSQHGFIFSLIDLSTTQVWSDVSSLIGPTAESPWNGQANTTAILGQPGMTSSAAKLCDDYVNADYGTGVFSDWYLPALDELALVNNSIYNVNKAIEGDGDPSTTEMFIGYYWSSTELDAGQAFYFLFAVSGYVTMKSTAHSVRAIRAF